MIKIDLLLPTDLPQVSQLLSYEEYLSGGKLPAELNGLTFWQHWLPCNWHMFPSTYVAREDGSILGLIALSSLGKSASCWRIDHLVVHPEHRGRGLATELLRYVFALFGGQGVSHFVAYCSDANSSALRLFGSCGFKRAAKLTAFNLNGATTAPSGIVEPSDATAPSGVAVPPIPASAAGLQTMLRKATAADSHGLFRLFQDTLPPDIRIVFGYVPGDFKIVDSPTYNKVRNKLFASQSQFWLWQDPQRETITSAVKIVLDRLGNTRVEFAVHPGWKHQAADFVTACLQQLRHLETVKSAVTYVFDFDPPLAAALAANGMETAGHYCLLTREHWVRAKKVKHAAIGVPSIAKPAPI